MFSRYFVQNPVKYFIFSDIKIINYFNEEFQCLPGTLYNSQLNILVISDIKIINYFNEESQCLPGTLYNSQLYFSYFRYKNNELFH